MDVALIYDRLAKQHLGEKARAGGNRPWWLVSPTFLAAENDDVRLQAATERPVVQIRRISPTAPKNPRSQIRRDSRVPARDACAHNRLLAPTAHPPATALSG